jgi:UDP-N-acetylmuramate dehydrogenase
MIQIYKNKSLRYYNSFHLDVMADYFVSIKSVQDIQALVTDSIFLENKRLVVWWGSNMLLTQDRFDGLVIHNAIMGKDIMYEDGSQVVIRVGAGEVWHDFVMRTVSQWRGGIENLALIPGSVGAAPIQNIGAYGVEVKDVVQFVEYVDLDDGTQHILDKDSCQFDYRDSIFKRELKERAFISYVVFRLYKIQITDYRLHITEKKLITQPLAPNDGSYKLKLEYKDIQQEIEKRGLAMSDVSLQNVADMVIAIRQRKLPDWTQIGTAGSFFKNPIVSVEEFQRLKAEEELLVGYEVVGGVKLSAGQLIELAWLKGIEKGSVWTYKNHALVLVHHGWWKGSDIVGLAKDIQDVVYEKFGVWLNPEVNYID